MARQRSVDARSSAFASRARRGGRSGRWLAAIAFGVLLAACGTLIQPIDPAYKAANLTAEGSDTYSLSASGGTVTITAAATNQGNNSRAAFYPAEQTPLADEQTCATWSAQSDPAQQGATLRLTTVNGVTRAITVTKNIFLFAFWTFDVHVWDTSTPNVFTKIGQFDLSSVFVNSAGLIPFPWDLCARVIGNTLTFEAWVDGQPAPAWGDTTHGASVTLPGGWDYAGNAGWYIAHLAPGASARYTNLVAGAPTASIPAAMSVAPR
ncbi:MAG TPA: hypothetical protein VIB48_16865 [Acidimicrobiia bacterium]